MQASNATATVGFFAVDKKNSETVVTTAAIANMVRITRLVDAPEAFHLSAIQPPAISPTNPLKNTIKLALPAISMLKPCTLLR